MEARCGKASVAFVPCAAACGERPHVRLLLRGLKLVDGRVLLLTLHILPDGCVNLQDNVFAAEPGGKRVRDHHRYGQGPGCRGKRD